MPGCAWFRCYAELNDFLPLDRRSSLFIHCFKQPASIKDMIESLGIPHVEIDLMLVNGESVNFHYLVCDGDFISIFPVFKALDISSVSRCRPPPLNDYRFILDTHLGRLAAYLRMLGFDCLYHNDLDDPALAVISADEQRILLTRDKRLLMRKQICYGYYVRATQPRRQLSEVLARFDLYALQQPFTRCMKCNGAIMTTEKNEIISHLPPRVSARHDEYWQCRHCGKVYWKGTHYRRMEQLIAAQNRMRLEAGHDPARMPSEPACDFTEGSNPLS